MFSTEQLIADCRKAIMESDARHIIDELLQHAVSQPAATIRALGEPVLAGIEKIYQADDLTIINVVWGPGMALHPHNHEMWAVIGIYTGREDNIFWRRLKDADGGKIEAVGLGADGKLFVVLASQGGTWSIMLADAAGTGCIVATGENWQPIAAKATGPEA